MSALLDLARHFPVSWKMVRRCRLPEGRLGEPYYVSFEPGAGIFGEQWTGFDKRGVLWSGQYNPVSIAQYALHCYEQLSTGDAGARERFLRQAAYLRDAQQENGAYVYAFAHPRYGLEPGWLSGLAQGEAASVLFRAYAITNDDAYLNAAMRALEPYTRDLAHAGISYMRGNDVFFEELAGCPVHILNGHISAAFALWEAQHYGFASTELCNVHAAAIETLVRWLPHYDAGGWSFYQLALRGGNRHYAPITYHQTHINFLRVYAAMTGRPEFEAMSRRWRRGLDRWDVRMRVWLDGVSWIGEVAALRLRRGATPPWQPMTFENGSQPAAACVQRG
jgi:hypothetical protein